MIFSSLLSVFNVCKRNEGRDGKMRCKEWLPEWRPWWWWWWRLEQVGGERRERDTHRQAWTEKEEETEELHGKENNNASRELPVAIEFPVNLNASQAEGA